ncbi:MAG: hypothetical protein ACI8UR_000785 [Natronomonas sp.]|jgi:hypothetical protein|uniref:hypothetical protein n=1 Tax=Natronomonas sp. TaxID=2184060 RepID=UPI003988C5D6
MSRPQLADVRAMAGERVRITVPKPRENQRLVGVVEVDGDRTLLRIDQDGVSETHATVELRERERDGVLRAFHGTDGTALIGRVKRIDAVKE